MLPSGGNIVKVTATAPREGFQLLVEAVEEVQIVANQFYAGTRRHWSGNWLRQRWLSVSYFPPLLTRE